MAREQFQSLTEQMYYILLALLEPRCGVDISQKAMEISRGRMQIGPGTLYTLLLILICPSVLLYRRFHLYQRCCFPASKSHYNADLTAYLF